jgi:hypothetical protein
LILLRAWQNRLKEAQPQKPMTMTPSSPDRAAFVGAVVSVWSLFYAFRFAHCPPVGWFIHRAELPHLFSRVSIAENDEDEKDTPSLGQIRGLLAEAKKEA